MAKFPNIGAPDWGFAENTKETVTNIKFGDGYELRMKTGLNHQKGTWSPRWSHLDPQVGEAAYAWVKPLINLKAFYWDHPLEGTKKVICTSASLTHDVYNNCVLAMSLEEDFNP